MSDIKFFEEPPRTKTTRTPYPEFWEALKTNPGKWAKYPKALKSGNTPSGYKAAHPHCEFVSRNSTDFPGLRDMWCRYVGESGESK